MTRLRLELAAEAGKTSESPPLWSDLLLMCNACRSASHNVSPQRIELDRPCQLFVRFFSSATNHYRAMILHSHCKIAAEAVL